MKVNIYYGGRGLPGDPTICVLNIIERVLEELNVKVERYNLYDMKNAITSLPQSLKSADGIILATTVEWYGIGGYMQSFLDACWLYGDKEKIQSIYMMPIVMSTTYGEREAKLQLAVAWEILGGRPCTGICGYITEESQIEENKRFVDLIEKRAENVYRTINQQIVCLPASNQVVNKTVALYTDTNLTPQETEQLSQYASDDEYLQKSKEDIQELASYFKGMLNSSAPDETEFYTKEFKNNFTPIPGTEVSYKFNIEGKKKPFIIKVKETDLDCAYGSLESPDVEINLTEDILNEIIAGRQTFQRAFMSGNMKMKGDFKVLRMLDQLFIFKEAI